MAVILITVIGSSDHDQITMGIETLRNIVIITTDIFAVYRFLKLRYSEKAKNIWPIFHLKFDVTK